MTLLRATAILRATDASPPPCADRIALSYEARFLRRKRLSGAGGLEFLVDLPKAENLEAGDMFVLDDGRAVRVEAEAESLIAVRGDLPRLAWHIGNRHTPCQIEDQRLLIQSDKVLADMLRGLGAQLEQVTAPFTPEGGAYGMGRTHAHAHGHTHFGADGTPQGGTDHKDLAADDGQGGPSAHSHAHDHGPSHSHSHSHADGSSHTHTHTHTHTHAHDGHTHGDHSHGDDLHASHPHAERHSHPHDPSHD